MTRSLPHARLTPMRARDPHEDGRVASPLELFFDLVFVVAVSIASMQLHHELTEGHIANALSSYALVFFAIWWAWMNFTWFATSFATDDWLYRVVTFVQMAGVLVLAAGVPDVFHQSFGVVIGGYVVMRVAMIFQWLRASRADGPMRQVTRRYAAAIGVVQVLWVLSAFVDGPARGVLIVVLVLAELSVPIFAERAGSEHTPWHAHHITERYGLFTLIVLGESLLASANAVIEALHDDEALAPLITISVLALVVTAALWWIYFWPPHAAAISSFRSSIRYGYVHYFVFAAAGAFSAGVEVAIDVLTHHGELSEIGAAYAVTVPIAVFVLGIWFIAMRDYADRTVNVAVPLAAVLVLLAPLVTVGAVAPFVITAVIMVLVVSVLVTNPPLPSPGSQTRTAKPTPTA